MHVLVKFHNRASRILPRLEDDDTALSKASKSLRFGQFHPEMEYFELKAFALDCSSGVMLSAKE